MAEFETRGINFDEFKSGGLLQKHAVVTLNIGNRISIGLKIEEKHENLCRDGRADF